MNQDGKEGKDVLDIPLPDARPVPSDTENRREMALREVLTEEFIKTVDSADVEKKCLLNQLRERNDVLCGAKNEVVALKQELGELKHQCRHLNINSGTALAAAKMKLDEMGPIVTMFGRSKKEEFEKLTASYESTILSLRSTLEEQNTIATTAQRGYDDAYQNYCQELEKRQKAEDAKKACKDNLEKLVEQQMDEKLMIQGQLEASQKELFASKKEVEGSREIIAKLESENKELKHDKEKMKTLCSRQKATALKLHQDLSSVTEENGKLQSERDCLKNMVAELKGRCSAAEKVTKQKALNANNRKDLEQTKKKNADLETERDGLKSQLSAIKQKCEEMEKTASEREASDANRDKQAEDAIAECARLNHELDIIRQAKTSLEKSAKETEKSEKSWKKKCANLEKKLGKLQTDDGEQGETFAQLDGRIKALVAELEKKGRDVTTKTEQLSSALTDKNSLSKQVCDLKAKLDQKIEEYQEIAANFEAYRNGKHAEQKQQPNVDLALSDLDQKLVRLSNELAMVTNERDQLQESGENLRIDLASCQEKLSSAREEAASLRTNPPRPVSDQLHHMEMNLKNVKKSFMEALEREIDAKCRLQVLVATLQDEVAALKAELSAAKQLAASRPAPGDASASRSPVQVSSTDQPA